MGQNYSIARLTLLCPEDEEDVGAGLVAARCSPCNKHPEIYTATPYFEPLRRYSHMCGIAGILFKNSVGPVGDILLKMLTEHHRRT
jgi:hypothetical protein